MARFLLSVLCAALFCAGLALMVHRPTHSKSANVIEETSASAPTVNLSNPISAPIGADVVKPQTASPVHLVKTEVATSTDGGLTPAERTEWQAQLPTRDEASRDVGVDEHATPKSIRKMAPIFADLMRTGKASLEGAQKSFSKFADCAEDGDNLHPKSLRLTCYLNAKRLASTYPDQLQTRLSELAGKLDSRTRDLLKAYNKM